MTDYWYFLSYARRDAVGVRQISKFHKWLSRAVGRAAGLPSSVSEDEIGFFDTRDIKPGDVWRKEIASAIQTCRVFICLYSPAYFNSEYCGKELQAFMDRLRAASSLTSSLEQPPLIIPILWDRADRLPKPLPSTLKGIQYASRVGDKSYEREGLFQLMSLKKHSDECTRFFEDMAATVLQRSQEHRLPPASELSSLRDLTSAFTSTGEEEGPQLSPHEGGDAGPSTAAFVFVAAKDNEIRDKREDTGAYGPEGGRDWRPYHNKAVGHLGQALAAQEDLFYEHIPVDANLLSRLRDAEQWNKVVVVIVDPWTIQLKTYHDSMIDYDKSSFINIEVLIPWNQRDTETVQVLDSLHVEVKQTFRRHYILTSSYIRDSIGSIDELERELIGAISRVRSRILQMSDFVRPMDTRLTLPRYSKLVGNLE